MWNWNVENKIDGCNFNDFVQNPDKCRVALIVAWNLWDQDTLYRVETQIADELISESDTKKQKEIYNTYVSAMQKANLKPKSFEQLLQLKCFDYNKDFESTQP